MQTPVVAKPTLKDSHLLRVLTSCPAHKATFDSLHSPKRRRRVPRGPQAVQQVQMQLHIFGQPA